MNLEKTIAGDTLEFTVEVTDYPASDGWTLKYRLTPRFSAPTQAPVTLTAATNADGKSYDITVAPATTAAWTAGFYTWARWVEKAGARQTLDESGQLEVKSDPALTTQGHDARSHARKMLDAIEATLQGKATKDQRSYTIGSRSLERLSPEELEAWREKYRSEVAAEEAADRLDSGASGGPRLYARL
jgi:hypothetical protein